MDRTIFFVVFLCIVNVIFGLRGQKTCKLLVLEGGGTKGAFQSGAFRAMVDFLNPEDIRYDVIAGASVGSLNGAAFAATEIGKEEELSAKLHELWSTITSDDAIANWPYFGLIRGFFDKNSFFDNSPLQQYIKSKLELWGNKLHRRYSIATVNVNTAETLRITESVGAEELPKFILASAAVPGIFPYSVIDGEPFIDGGTVDNTNIRGGIERCREIVGDDDSAITIDVMLTNTVSKYAWMDLKDSHTYTIYSRGNEIASDYKTYYYFNDALAAFPNANWRYLIKPKESLPNYPVIALSFDRETLRKAEEIGYNIAKELIITEGPNIRKMFTTSPPRPRERIKLH